MTANRSGERGGILSRDDLFLLMESYRNTIELNTTLLEQQKLIVEGNKAIADSNEKICGRIEEVVKKLDACALEISKTHQHWIENRLKYNAQNTEEHLKIKGYLNVLTISVGTLCVGLVGVVITAISIFEGWGDYIHMIEDISKALGVG